MKVTRKQLEAAGIDPGHPSPLRARLCSRGGPKATSDRKARERQLEALAVAHGLPAPIFEYRFNQNAECPEINPKTGKPWEWRFDMLFDGWLAVECQGGLWTHGRHVQPQALRDEYHKLNVSLLQDYRVLLFVKEDIDSGAAFQFVARVIKGGTS